MGGSFQGIWSSVERLSLLRQVHTAIDFQRMASYLAIVSRDREVRAAADLVAAQMKNTAVHIHSQLQAKGRIYGGGDDGGASGGGSSSST